MKILVVLFRSIGDILMGTTVLHALRKKYPNDIIDFVTEKQNVPILSGNPDISNVVICDNYFDANVLYVKGRYDKIFRLNMANHFETCWHHIPKWQNQHLVEWYAKRAELEDFNDKDIYIYPSKEDYAFSEQIMEKIPQEKLVAIHTSSGVHEGAKVESKDWPISYFDIIADKACKNGFTVVQIGVSSDKKMNNEKVVDLRGKMSLMQTACFLKKCSTFIGIDSAPVYLAAWAGIPTISIMGATQGKSENYTGPLIGPRTDNVSFIHPIRPNDPSCRPVPCYISCPLNNPCINNILPNQIWNKFKRIHSIN